MKKILLLAGFLFCGSWAHALTLLDLKNAVRQHIQDQANPTVRYSDTKIIEFLNEGQRDLVNQTWCLQKTTSQSLTARTTYYSLPTDLIAIQEFNFQEAVAGRKRPLEEKSERGMYQNNPDYERISGPPFYYFVRNSTSAATQLEYGINPVPSTGTALGTLYIDYYNQATDLSANSDVPLAGFRHLYPYHSALVYYAVSRAKMASGDGLGADYYMKLYQGMVALMIDRLGRMPNYNPSFGGAPK